MKVRPATPEHRRIRREKQTLAAMMRIYCRARHDRHGGLCPDCSALLQYALARLDRCPFRVDKPTCARCTVHCYRPEMRSRISAVMRFAGPRMVHRHPILAVLHLLDGFRGPRPRRDLR